MFVIYGFLKNLEKYYGIKLLFIKLYYFRVVVRYLGSCLGQDFAEILKQ